MGGTKIHPRALAVLVPLAGLAAVAGADMARSFRMPTGRELGAFAAFSLLGMGWGLLSIRATRSDRRGRMVLALAPVAYQALIPIAQPLVAAGAAAAILAFDWTVHRRPWHAGLFNIAQAVVGTWIAGLVVGRLAGVVPLPNLQSVVLGGLLGATVCTVFGGVSLAVVIHLASNRSVQSLGMVSFPALASEAAGICFSALLALGWAVHPALVVPVALPLTTLFLTISRLERREASLESKQDELQAIQELGLEVSSQLDPERLAEAVTRIVAEDLEATGALLGFLGESPDELTIAAVFDPRHAMLSPPRKVRRDLLDDAFFSRGEPWIVTGERASNAREFLAFRPRGVIAHPLTILGRPSGVVAAYHDTGRAPFSGDDARRLAGLCRFIEVAFNNARLYEDLREMQAQLLQNEKLSALGELVSGVAHELNNPLATVMGTSELLERQELPGELQRLVRMIRREAGRAARIVRNLLTFSRRQKPQASWHDVGEIMEEVAELRRAACRRSRIELRVEAGDDVPPLMVDADQIHQVLINLVNNAIHAIEDTGQGGTIVMRSRRHGGRVQISVVDDGPGIPEEILPRIFNPFFTTKKVGKGTGLGLSICHGIIQEHGGSFRVRSAPGQGASFVIELPVPCQGPVEAERKPQDSGVAGSPLDGAGRKVLVVDDEEGIRSLVAEALAIWSFDVRLADSGEAALELLAGGDFDLVISDLRMPGVDGMQLWERSRGLERPVPFIFSTGDAVSEDVYAFLERSGVPVLVKPFTLLTLREAIERVLGTPEPVAG